MELEIPVLPAKDVELSQTGTSAGDSFYVESSPLRDELEQPVDDLYTRIIEGTAPIPEEIAAPQIQGLWSGEAYVARQQYLYDLNEMMKDLSEKAGR